MSGIPDSNHFVATKHCCLKRPPETYKVAKMSVVGSSLEPVKIPTAAVLLLTAAESHTDPAAAGSSSSDC